MPRKSQATGPKTPKTVSVRITVAQFNALREIAEGIGGTVNSLTQRAVGNWLSDEGAYWQEKAAEAMERRAAKLSLCHSKAAMRN